MNDKALKTWVVYTMTLSEKKDGRNAVCTQTAWDAMEAARPGYHKLIQSHIGNEGEAERLARDLQTPATTPKPTRRSNFARPLASSSETVQSQTFDHNLFQVATNMIDKGPGPTKDSD